MEIRLPRSLIVLMLVMILFLISFAIYKDRVLDTQYVTVRFVHSHDVAVYKNNKKLTSELGSGDRLKLKKGTTYTVLAKGDSGFEDKKIDFDLGDSQKTISVNPYYSSTKLASILSGQTDIINQAIAAKYPEVDLYQIRTGKLYHWGDWYGTVLVYKGAYGSSSDPLRIVLQKNNDQWEVKTNPPNITLSKYAYPHVPIDILNDVNNSPQFHVDISPPQAHGAHLRR